MFLQEAYRHHKTIGAWGTGIDTLQAFGIVPGDPGILSASTADDAFTAAFLEAMGWHRHWERAALTVA